MQNKDGESALMLAYKKGDTEAVEALIAAKADVNLQVRRMAGGRTDQIIGMSALLV